jgi:hypothetical protein
MKLPEDKGIYNVQPVPSPSSLVRESNNKEHRKKSS